MSKEFSFDILSKFSGASLPMSKFTKIDNKEFRWSLAAREICFSKPLHSMFFRMGKVVPVVRGNGVYQPIMNQMLEELNTGAWVHIFPEGKVNDEKKHLRLKWGVGRLVADAEQTPIVLPFYHFGMDDILPNKLPYRPQINKKLTILFGKPIYFESLVKEMKESLKTPVSFFFNFLTTINLKNKKIF